MTLSEFLLARIAEDEDDADERHTVDCDEFNPPGFPCDCGYPARVLAECEAKRRIVKVVGRLGGHYEPDAGRIAPEILRWLAAPYAAHPDYREEWKP